MSRKFKWETPRKGVKFYSSWTDGHYVCIDKRMEGSWRVDFLNTDAEWFKRLCDLGLYTKSWQYMKDALREIEQALA